MPNPQNPGKFFFFFVFFLAYSIRASRSLALVLRSRYTGQKKVTEGSQQHVILDVLFQYPS